MKGRRDDDGCFVTFCMSRSDKLFSLTWVGLCVGALAVTTLVAKALSSPVKVFAASDSAARRQGMAAAAQNDSFISSAWLEK